MQQKDLEALIRSLSTQSNPAQTASQLENLVHSPTGEQLASQLMQQDTLRQAAEYARSGDIERAKHSVQQALMTPEGARIAKQIQSILKKR